jgi:hypothetical protein
MPVLSLLPSPETAPDSSLSFMMGEMVRLLAGGRGGFFVDSLGRIATEAFRQALDDAAAAGAPVLVAGTAFAFVHWLELASTKGWGVRLPTGSRVMETGGYKGRSRALSREELYRGIEAVLGVPQDWIVNEYGMTEMLSQFYEPVLALRGRSDHPRLSGDPGAALAGRVGGGAGGGRQTGPQWRFHRAPPWVRTLVLDPLTLAPVQAGEVGILAHLDLANLGSVSALLTEDLGRAVPGGFRLLGRSPGAEPRGCSLAMEAFLRGSGPSR